MEKHLESHGLGWFSVVHPNFQVLIIVVLVVSLLIYTFSSF